MANGPIIKLQPNVPVTMTLRYVDHRPGSQYGDQISVKGDVDGVQACMVYLPISKEGTLQQLGVIGPRGPDGKSYPLLIQSPTIKMLKTMDGNKQPIGIELVGSSGASATPTARPTQGSNTAGAATDKKAKWESFGLTMDGCIDKARELWGDEAERDVVAATAHTLFIQCVKEGILRTPPRAASPATADQKIKIANLGLTLGYSMDALNNECAKEVGTKSVDDLTDQTAAKLIEVLTTKVAAKQVPEEVPF